MIGQRVRHSKKKITSGLGWLSLNTEAVLVFLKMPRRSFRAWPFCWPWDLRSTAGSVLAGVGWRGRPRQCPRLTLPWGADILPVRPAGESRVVASGCSSHSDPSTPPERPACPHGPLPDKSCWVQSFPGPKQTQHSLALSS